MTITPEQILQAIPWLTVIVFIVVTALERRQFIAAFVQIAVLALRGVPGATASQPAPPLEPVPVPIPQPIPVPIPPPVPVPIQPLPIPPPKPIPAPPVVVPAPPVIPAPVPVPSIPAKPTGPYADYPEWFRLGLHDLGFHETGNNQGIERFIAEAHTGELGQPWCAIWVNAKLEQSGVPGSRSPSSQSFRTHAAFVALAGPAPGAIVVYWRGSRAGGEGHVGFYVDETATHVRTLGGNESDLVQIEPLPKDTATFGLVGPPSYFWPKSVPLPKIGAIPTPAGSLAHVTVDPTGSAGAAVLMPAPVSGVGMSGKVSWFGGPEDTGVKPDEGLALVEPAEMGRFPPGTFLDAPPPGTTGLARRLNPAAHFIAMRWDYKATPRASLQGMRLTVSAAKTGKTFSDVVPVDWGPNIKTGRIADLSHGLMTDLGITTDDVVTVTVPTTGAAVAESVKVT